MELRRSQAENLPLQLDNVDRKYNWPSTRSQRILRKASCLDPILERVMFCSARGLPDSLVNTSGSNSMHEEKDTSQNVTRVSYNGEALSSRNQFTWILFGRYKNIKVTLNEREKNELIFKVKWPKNRERPCLPQYEAHRDAYLEECLDTTPSLSRLGMDSLQSQQRLRIYLPKVELGRGSFGKINRIVNVSTGCE